MRREWRRRVGRSLRRTARSWRPTTRESAALSVVALAAGVAVFVVATTLFPYHSVNHDEGVYLHQAAMLLEGKLWLEPAVPDAVRPWFFVDDGGRLYSKYTPVAAAVFAPGLAVGAPRLVLAVVATANVALVGLLARTALGRRAAPVAAVLFATAPLFLLSSSVFLSYAPTTLFNLLFALGYVRSRRRESRRYAVLAGVAVGLAFFSRPYTAVLFALPFIGHALLTLGRTWRARFRGAATRTAALAVTGRLGIVAALGSAFVALALGYNWLQTGDPLVFPYQAFAHADGIGFGHREILNHEREYTPALALQANGRVLWAFLTRWGPLGALGTALAAVGLVTALFVPLWQRDGSAGRRRVDGSVEAGDGGPPSPLTVRGLLAGVAVTVPAGNVLFWGNLNVLADVSDPTDGLIASLGPFYHFDLLIPAAVFAAAGTLALADRVPALAAAAARVVPVDDADGVRRVVLAAVLVASLVAAGGATAAALGPPVDRNAEYRDDIGPAYDPFESTDFDDALVFVPTPYGDWIAHPFQRLRNDPGFDGDAVYVLDGDADRDAASLAAFDDRTPYRFTYRGSWPPDDDGLTPVLEPLEVRSGDGLRVRTEVGVVSGAQSGTVRLAADGESTLAGVQRIEGDTTTVEWVIEPDRARVAGDNLTSFSDSESVPVDGPTDLALSVTFTQPGGGTVTYRQELTVVRSDDRVAVLWPAEERVCRLTTDCGTEETYVEGGDYVAGVSLNATVEGTSRNGSEDVSAGT